jgi:hypothetical protein
MASLEQQQDFLAQQPSADSLWGELGGLNLVGLDDWEEPQYVDVEGLIKQLVRLTCWSQTSQAGRAPLRVTLAMPE